MIRFSVESDIKQILSLWNEAFGDSEDEIMFFLNSRYQPENTLIYDIDGEVASMLFLLEGDMCINGADYPSYYLYAACTARKHRGRGCMASLLDFAKNTAESRGYYFICLKPGEESLFKFYEKHGYKTVFKKKILTVDKNELINIDTFDLSGEKTLKNPAELRNDSLSDTDFFKWSNDAVEFAFLHNKLYGGEAFESCKGYLLHVQNSDKIYVKENTFTCQNIVKVLALFAANSPVSRFIVELPINFETEIGKSNIVPSAMMLAVNEEAEKIMSEIDGAYLGLTLD